MNTIFLLTLVAIISAVEQSALTIINNKDRWIISDNETIDIIKNLAENKTPLANDSLSSILNKADKNSMRIEYNVLNAKGQLIMAIGLQSGIYEIKNKKFSVPLEKLPILQRNLMVMPGDIQIESYLTNKVQKPNVLVPREVTLKNRLRTFFERVSKLPLVDKVLPAAWNRKYVLGQAVTNEMPMEPAPNNADISIVIFPDDGVMSVDDKTVDLGIDEMKEFNDILSKIGNSKKKKK